MKSCISLAFYFLWCVSINGQSPFDKRIDSLFFSLPRNVNMSEIGFLLREDSTFSNIQYSAGCSPEPCISARFVNHPLLHFLTGSATISFSYNTEENLSVRTIDMRFEEVEIESFMCHLNYLHYFLNEYSYFTDKQEGYDKFPGMESTFYSDWSAFVNHFPRTTLHHNFHKEKIEKPGHMNIQVSFTEHLGQ